MKTYKGKKDLAVYKSPYPKNITIGKEFSKPELLSNIPKGILNRDAIGIVLATLLF